MLDHGILNLPLHRRGNIDTQIDQYKKEQEAAKKKAAAALYAQHKTDQEAAKQLVEELGEDALARWAARLKCTPAQAKKQLLSQAHWLPLSVIRGLQQAR